MPLASTKELLTAAQRRTYGIGAFNVIGLEHAEAIIRGAELERSPVILQVSQNAIRYHLGSLVPIGSACAQLAASAEIPVALHLDHATTWHLCEEALDIGFSSVMLDASTESLEQNVASTTEVAQRVHQRRASIEAEIGVVGGKDGAESTADGMTDAEQASWYVSETGIDALAVAVGTTHYMVDKTAALDLDLISSIRERVDIPLVLHGSSGVPDDDLREAVQRGIVKVNTATELNKAFTSAVRGFLANNTAAVDPRTYLSEARDATVTAVRHRMQVIGSGGMAS